MYICIHMNSHLYGFVYTYTYIYLYIYNLISTMCSHVCRYVCTYRYTRRVRDIIVFLSIKMHCVMYAYAHQHTWHTVHTSCSLV